MEQKGNRRLKTFLEILLVSTRLGLTSFGGPIAHLGYFHEEYIRRRQWMDEESYGDLVALCQFLPGPSSSQVGIGVGVIRGGLLGGILSFIGFTLPSVLILILFASFLLTFNFGNAGWIHGLKIVAVAVVAHAVLGMAKTLTPDIRRKSIALLALVSTLLFPTPFTQIIVILLSGVVGFFIFQHHIAKLLILGALPFWEALRRNLPIKKALMGVNAAVVGILLSALYHPIWTTSILNTKDFVLAAVLFGMLAFWKFPPWAVVLVGALGGMLISAV